MLTFFNVWKRNGMKIGGTLLLGTLITSFAASIVTFILYLVGALLVVALGFGALGVSDPQALLNDPSQLGGLIFLVIFFVFIIYGAMFFIQSFHLAGGFGIANEATTNGSTRFESYFSLGFRYMWRTFLLTLLISIYTFIAVIPFLILITVTSYADESGNTSLAILAGIGAFIMLLLPIFTGISTMFAFPMLIAENIGAWKAFTHSLKLFRKAKGKHFTTFLWIVLNVLIFYIIFVVLFLSFGLSLFTDTPSAADLMGLFIFYMLTFLIMPFFQGGMNILLAVRYHRDMRALIFPGNPPHSPTQGPGSNPGQPSPYPDQAPLDQQPSSPYPAFPRDPHEPAPPNQQSNAPYPSFPTDPHNS
ncbi:hypothetical protein [Marininema halotolerans]|uniref:Membrane domain of glycerophosphoryl diester phosphodiesterase n=1 Tax=Marininema halotolerans TaxID=1155944 RepID=A0A1I6S7V5_9BACL|nr:hypothetical protein [Marininema halotolerans]SFS72993.1 hypothetical protein SAMN05444972_106204 [Marininema halotolerans]